MSKRKPLICPFAPQSRLHLQLPYCCWWHPLPLTAQACILGSSLTVLSHSSLTSKPSGYQAGTTTKQIQNLTFPHSFHCYNSGLCHRSLSPGILQSPPMRSPWFLLPSTISSQSSPSALFRPHVSHVTLLLSKRPAQVPGCLWANTKVTMMACETLHYPLTVLPPQPQCSPRYSSNTSGVDSLQGLCCSYPLCLLSYSPRYHMANTSSPSSDLKLWRSTLRPTPI